VKIAIIELKKVVEEIKMVHIFHDGQRVKVNGKEGIVREIGDKIKVKMDDGSLGFFAENEVTAVLSDSRLKGSKYDRLKAEGKLREHQSMMEPEAAGQDPLSQPQRKTGRGVGENQTVLGKEVCEDALFSK
jgi:hypothetical protein